MRKCVNMQSIKITYYVHDICRVFYCPCPLRHVFFIPKNTQGTTMQLTLIKNTDTSAQLAHKIARTTYAETGASSLLAVEAMTSMIKNLSDRTGIAIEQIVQDRTLFESLTAKSPKHMRLFVSSDNRAFQMCVRVAHRMLKGALRDCCNGAIRFHHADIIPDWATSRGYVADIDNILFYR